LERRLHEEHEVALAKTQAAADARVEQARKVFDVQAVETGMPDNRCFSRP